MISPNTGKGIHIRFGLIQAYISTAFSTCSTVILDTICCLHEQTVRQVQDELKPLIVTAILDYDEISHGRALSHSTTPAGDGKGRLSGSPASESKRLVDSLDEFHKQFTYLGLDGAYIEQIFIQLMHHVCVISLNNLMLRQELCNWKAAMRIRYNVSCLEEWLRKKQMVCEGRGAHSVRNI